jgi:hypothetical protein
MREEQEEEEEAQPFKYTLEGIVSVCGCVVQRYRSNAID